MVGGVLEVVEEGGWAADAGDSIVPDYESSLDADDEGDVVEALRSDLRSKGYLCGVPRAELLGLLDAVAPRVGAWAGR